MSLRLVIFDVDGTLVDSQGHILASMDGAFRAHALPTPARDAILSIVGLSLPEAFVRLVPDHAHLRDDLTQAYKDTFMDLRKSGEAHSPLYPGAAEALEAAKPIPAVSAMAAIVETIFFMVQVFLVWGAVRVPIGLRGRPVA